MPAPEELIRRVQERILYFEASQLSLSEAETRRALIEPVFTAIGWDTGNPVIVRMEWRKSPGDRPVDYAFMVNGVPKLLIEAEKLREDITDRKWRDQLLLYSTQVGVKWCALTNGNIIRIYNSLAEEAAPDKLLFEIEIRTVDTLAGLSMEAFMEKLSLLSEESLREGRIDEAWDSIYTTRKVFDYLEKKREDLIDDIVKRSRLNRKSVDALLDQIIELRESFLEREEETSPDEPKPWIANGKEWHLVNRLKSKSVGQLSDTAERLLRINEIIGPNLPDVTGPYWCQKHYVSFKVGNSIWLAVYTHPTTLSADVKCDASRFSLEELSERLGVTVFDTKASLSEKLNLPSSIQKSKNENCINLKIKPDFDLENGEFVKFLREAYEYFLE
jgi:predicted type IV restriction endonuclease